MVIQLEQLPEIEQHLHFVGQITPSHENRAISRFDIHGTFRCTDAISQRCTGIIGAWLEQADCDIPTGRYYEISVLCDVRTGDVIICLEDESRVVAGNLGEAVRPFMGSKLLKHIMKGVSRIGGCGPADCGERFGLSSEVDRWRAKLFSTMLERS